MYSPACAWRTSARMTQPIFEPETSGIQAQIITATLTSSVYHCLFHIAQPQQLIDRLNNELILQRYVSVLTLSPYHWELFLVQFRPSALSLAFENQSSVLKLVPALDRHLREEIAYEERIHNCASLNKRSSASVKPNCRCHLYATNESGLLIHAVRHNCYLRTWLETNLLRG